MKENLTLHFEDDVTSKLLFSTFSTFSCPIRWGYSDISIIFGSTSLLFLFLQLHLLPLIFSQFLSSFIFLFSSSVFPSYPLSSSLILCLSLSSSALLSPPLSDSNLFPLT